MSGAPNNVGRAVPTDPTLLRYASAITEQKRCWEFLAQNVHINKYIEPTKYLFIIFFEPTTLNISFVP